MSEACSISTKRRYGLKRLSRVWGIPRSTLNDRRRRARQPLEREPLRRGPKPRLDDDSLLAEIRDILNAAPTKSFHGEGYRKVWARLRAKGIFACKERIRRLMGKHGLLAPNRTGKPNGPRNHDGTIIPIAPNLMWGTDMTAGFTLAEGQVAVFAAVDHHTGECVGIHAAKRGTRHEALEPLRQGVKCCFGDYGQDAAKSLLLRHDNGSQYVSRDFQAELMYLGITSSPSFVRAPEGNGVIERFFRTLKEQLLWVEDFADVEALREALYEFRDKYNENWIMHRHNFRTPAQVRKEWLSEMAA